MERDEIELLVPEVVREAFSRDRGLSSPPPEPEKIRRMMDLIGDNE